MVIAELIAQKVQAILGKNYHFYVDDAFNKKFTNNYRLGMYGVEYDMNVQAFNELGKTVVAIVSAVPSQLYNTPYRFFQGTYTIQFWVPIDFWRSGKADEPNIYADAEKLKNALTDGEIALMDNGVSLRGLFTASELQGDGRSVDRTGAFSRVTYRMTGSASIADARVGLGADVAVGFEIDGAEYRLGNIYNFFTGATTSANALLNSTDIAVKQEVAQTGLGVSFSVDDYVDESNKAFDLLRDKAFANKAILTPTATDAASKYKVKTNVYKRSVLVNSFWGVLEADYIVSDRAALGSYKVSISDDGEGL